MPAAIIVIAVVIASPIVGHRPPHIEDAVVDHAQVAVVSGRYIQGDQPVVDAIKVNLYSYWLPNRRRFLVLCLVVLLSLIRLLVGLILVFRLILIAVLIFIVRLILILFL